jgi:peptide chain release factor subunit 1
MSETKRSLSKFRLKKSLGVLESKRGQHTELVSLYIPSDRQISDVLNSLRQELGTASNIKSKTTRKNVQDAIESTIQRVKLFARPPSTGLAVFSGAIPQNGPGSERMEVYVVIPPEPINIYYYRCDSHFHVQPLKEMLKEKESYGLLVMDGSGAAFATLRGDNLEIVRKITSGISGKHRAGGQSARRFERLREAEVNEYFKRVGKYANEIFLEIPDLKGIIMGGPGPTKYDFEKEELLQYTLKDKILTTVDTAYIGEQGIEEIVAKSSDILQEVRYFEEKNLVQQFLYEIGHDTGLATYGEAAVRRSLEIGSVRLLILSEDLDKIRVTIKCTACGFEEERTATKKTISEIESEIDGKPCPKCSVPNLQIVEKKDLIEELVDLVDKSGAQVEIVSSKTEEGVALKKSFGGIAAILRYKQS